MSKCVRCDRKFCNCWWGKKCTCSTKQKNTLIKQSLLFLWIPMGEQNWQNETVREFVLSVDDLATFNPIRQAQIFRGDEIDEEEEELTIEDVENKNPNSKCSFSKAMGGDCIYCGMWHWYYMQQKWNVECLNQLNK